MDHRRNMARMRVLVRDIDTRLSDAYAAANDAGSPLQSTPTDGGSRPIGAHSDPTPAAALRRKSDDTRRLDNSVASSLDELVRLHRLTVEMTTIPDRRGDCPTCVRTMQILTLPYSVCIHCVQACDKSRRRAHKAGLDFDASTYFFNRRRNRGKADT